MVSKDLIDEEAEDRYFYLRVCHIGDMGLPCYYSNIYGKGVWAE